MKALSLMQPWAGLLVLGSKEVETRSWNTKHRGVVAIHASAKIPKEGYDLLKWIATQIPTGQWSPGGEYYNICTQVSAVLGEVEITNTYASDTTEEIIFFGSEEDEYFEKKLGDWSPGRWLWVCKNPVIFEKPVPAKGKLQLWEWEPTN